MTHPKMQEQGTENDEVKEMEKETSQDETQEQGAENDEVKSDTM